MHRLLSIIVKIWFLLIKCNKDNNLFYWGRFFERELFV